jgi:hypothetical protein
MRILDVVGEVASGAALMLFVPVAVLVMGIPIVLVARLLIELIERL